ncbi:MAG TPA: hypothetical protein VFH24_06025 [Gemmatimonadales bacterium]|nr:hypothetical protein [Gemmatimonadales bacterium]
MHVRARIPPCAHRLNDFGIYAYLAWKAADQPVARQQFIELGTRIDPGVWEDRPEFMEARKWALE